MLNNKRKYYHALFDTGSQMSMISEKIVMEIGFKPIGDTDIISVSSQPIKTEGFMVWGFYGSLGYSHLSKYCSPRRKNGQSG
ncbi:MAG: hypothetical protein OXD44_06410 [Gammaproteobacteria bacterium]|nr:hypothetical protein [Gammaproteobacteria bacterium]